MRFFGFGIGNFVRAIGYYQRDRELARRQREAQFRVLLFKAKVHPSYPEKQGYYPTTPAAGNQRPTNLRNE